jgi:hypothetical protein
MRIKRSLFLAPAILATWCLCATAQTAMPPGHPSSKQLMAAEGVMTSANIARGAADVCHIDAAKVARFKDVVHTSYPDAPDFDGEKLKTSNPSEYQKQIGEACPALNRGIDEVTQQ